MKKKVAILGGSGFIGKNLLDQLDSDRFEITLISRTPSRLSKWSDRFTILQADLNDADSLKTALKEQQIVVNLAAEVRNREMLYKTNVQGTVNLIEALRANQVESVIHLSSVGVTGQSYHSTPFVVTEQTEPKPENDYEKSKWKSEELLRNAAPGKFRLTILRPTNVFGEDHPFHALLNLFKHIEQKKPLPYTKKARVNYVYAGDVVHTVLHFLSHTEEGVFQVGNDMLLRDFYQLLGRSLNLPVSTVKIPGWIAALLHTSGVRKLDAVSNQTVYSDKKLQALGIHYPYGINHGINLTLAHYRERKLIG